MENVEKAKELVENYKRALAFLDGVSEWTYANFRHAIRLSGVPMQESEIRQQWQMAEGTLEGTESLRRIYREVWQEGLEVFSRIARELPRTPASEELSHVEVRREEWAEDTGEIEKRRPTAITVMCIIGFIGAAFAIPAVFSDAARAIGDWYPPYLAFSSTVGLVCLIGLWMMKRWSIIAYTALTILNQVVFLAMGIWNVFAVAIPAVVIAIGFSYFNRMD